jgi:HEPN domain-containing protein
MLSKEQHIQFWVKQAEDDWGAVEALLTVGKYVQCLFWAHLVAEKYAKALWIKYNTENVPPKTHNIAFLVSKTPLTVPEEMTELMLLTNRFNMEGRYPEYIQDMEITGNKDFAEDNIRQIKMLIIWLKENLQ